MIFSSGIPLLYFVFLIQTFLVYWFDKYLFLRVHRSPPRYGAELAIKSHGLMQGAPLLHLLIGFFMFSSTLIFNERKIFEASGLPNRLESLAVSFFTTSERFQSGHVILEFSAFGLILIIFIVVKVI